MSDAPNDTPDLTSESLHFQLLVAGTVIFLVALFWLMNMPHTKTYEARIALAASRLVAGVQALGCYAAFLAFVFAHKVLRKTARPGSGEPTH